jgi:hypothetical protein
VIGATALIKLGKLSFEDQMAEDASKRHDFFISRRGSVATVAREVADVLADKGYKVLVQDYDIPLGASFIEAMNEAVKNSRDLVILFTQDYETSPYTRKEFTSFEAERAQSPDERHIIVLRCEDIPLRGLLADNVYQDLVGIDDPNERRRRIIAAAEGQSQAQRPPPRPFIGVPPRVTAVVARDDAFDKLDNILLRDKRGEVTQVGAPAESDEIGRAAVMGMGGVGKTTLAAEYAYRYRAFYTGVCWCNAESRSALLSSLSALAVHVGATKPEPGAITQESIEIAARAALQKLSDIRGIWLLIYDNVGAPDEIADLLPTIGAKVLVTSRFSDWTGWAEEVPLDVLPLSAATSFLQKRAGRTDEVGAKGLAESLGCLPLALEFAASFCKTSGLSFDDYRVRSKELIRMKPRGAVYPNSVFATVSLSYDACANRPDAQFLIGLLAFIESGTIRTDIFPEEVLNTVQRALAIETLTAVSLLTVRNETTEWANGYIERDSTIKVHRLVQEVIRQRTYETDSFRAIRPGLYKLLEWQFVFERPGFSTLFDQLLWIIHYDPEAELRDEISFVDGQLEMILDFHKLNNGDIVVRQKAQDLPMVFSDTTSTYRLQGGRWVSTSSK